MTFAELKNLTKVFLGGDYNLPKNDDTLVAALSSAYMFAATKCTALRLLTTNKDSAIMRIGPGSTYVRMPKLPRDDSDRLDIDSELVPAIGRILAYYIAKDVTMKEYHKREALELMRDYEAKVVEYLEEVNATTEYEER